MTAERELNTATKRRTDKLIRETFIELLDDTDFSKINVRILCERADINRATFYRYYTDIIELRERIANELFDRIFTEVVERSRVSENDPTRSIRLLARSSLEEIFRFRKLCTVLFCNTNDDFFVQRISEAYRYMIVENGSYRDCPETHLLIHYAAAGMNGLLKNWLSEGCTSSIDEVAEITNRLILQLYQILDDYRV